MTIEQIEARLAEISKLIETASTEEIETLSHEVDGLVAERDALRAAEETRAAVRSRVASGAVGTAAAPVIEKKSGKGADSPEYRSAWLKNMAVFRQQDGSEQRLLGDLTAEERAAFTFTTANTASVVPTVTLNRIVELVQSMSPMYDDATKSGMTQGFAVPGDQEAYQHHPPDAVAVRRCVRGLARAAHQRPHRSREGRPRDLAAR